ncbi:hypothetical protein MMMDOFMJ_4611 [Methylobacterium gnaphalii]|nr:hypothetical protein MMMDOFMJ_4611 [Methylobacterium gnaphalii]
MHAQHDAAVAVFRGTRHHGLELLRHQHAEQVAVGEGVLRVTAREGRVGGEPVQRGRVEDVVVARSYLNRPRGAVDVLAGAGVPHAVGDIEDAVPGIRQSADRAGASRAGGDRVGRGRQRVAGRSHRGDRDVTGRRGARVRGGAVREVVLRNAEIGAHHRIGVVQQSVGLRQRAGGQATGADTSLVDRAEGLAVAARWLDRLKAACALGLLERKAACEVVTRSEVDLRAIRKGNLGDGAVKKAACECLIADRELLAGCAGGLIVRDGQGKVLLQGLLADLGAVQRQEGRKQVQDVDVGGCDVGRLRLGSADCTGEDRRYRNTVFEEHGGIPLENREEAFEPPLRENHA